MKTTPWWHRRPVVIAIVLAVLAGLAAGSALYFGRSSSPSATDAPKIAQPQKPQVTSPGSTPRAGAMSASDVAFLETRVNSPDLSVEAQALDPMWQFAPNSSPILPAGETLSFHASSFHHVGTYGLIAATRSDGQVFTYYVQQLSGHWLIYHAVQGQPAQSTSATSQAQTPAKAQLVDAVPTRSCISPAQLGKRTPVILIHGLLSSPAVWGSPSDPTSMYYQLSQPRLYVSTFDYSTVHTAWVDNDAIGRAFAAYIHCLAAASKQQAGGLGKVIVVAHSMGGDAARYAASIGGEASDIGLVITIATPNTGSGIANVFNPIVKAMCGAAVSVNPFTGQAASICPDISAFQGLSNYSPQIRALPWLPSQVAVHAIAGDERLSDTIGSATVIDDTRGDLVVSTASALQSRQGPSQDPTTTVTCTDSPTHLSFSCWHIALPHNRQVELATSDAIQAYLRSALPTPTPTPSQTPASTYAYWMADGGNWYVHGMTLKLQLGGAGLTGTMTWNAGPCDPNNPSAGMCSGSVPVTFQPAANGSIKGKFGKATYSDPNFPPNPSDPALDGTITLQPVAPYHAVIVAASGWDVGNHNFCQTGLADASRWCGA